MASNLCDMEQRRRCLEILQRRCLGKEWDKFNERSHDPTRWILDVGPGARHSRWDIRPNAVICGKVGVCQCLVIHFARRYHQGVCQMLPSGRRECVHVERFQIWHQRQPSRDYPGWMSLSVISHFSRYPVEITFA